MVLNEKHERMIIEMVSHKDWRGLYEFLNQFTEEFDLTAVYDKNGYNLLHLAAYKNSDKIL